MMILLTMPVSLMGLFSPMGSVCALCILNTKSLISVGIKKTNRSQPF